MTRKPTKKELEQKIVMLEEAAREVDRIKVRFQEYEEKFRIFVENATDIIYRTDAVGRLTFFNPAAVKLTGYAEKDLIGKFYTDLIRPDYRNEAERFYGLQFVKKIPITYGEFPLITVDKREMWVGQHVQLIIEDGHVTGFHAIARDITQDRQTQEALRKSEEIYSKLVDTIPDFIIRTDLEGKIFFVNDHSLQVSGYRRDEVEGMNVLMFIAPEDHARAIENTFLMMESRLGPKEYYLIMKDERKIPFEVNGDVLRNTDGTPFGIVTVCRDITERKKAEEEREKLISDLKQAFSEVKTLSGLLPICASCKKIRDDKGYWNLLEAYLGKHSDAKFSHGICPDCMIKLYPDMNKKIITNDEP